MSRSKIADESAEGGYVFVSHAHKDIRNIRKIRNMLEDNGLEPICFYLRCLTDDDEILDLIKREIDAREWFLLVDSKNARKSRWVKTELEYIKSKNSKKLVSVSLDRPEEIPKIIDRLSDSMQVMVSCSPENADVAQAIFDACLKRDLRVCFDVYGRNAGDVGADWANKMGRAVTDVMEKGCGVTVISSRTFEKAGELLPAAYEELKLLLAHSEFSLTVLVDDVSLPSSIESSLASVLHYRLKTPVTEEQVSEIMELIDSILLKRLHTENRRRST